VRTGTLSVPWLNLIQPSAVENTTKVPKKVGGRCVVNQTKEYIDLQIS